MDGIRGTNEQAPAQVTPWDTPKAAGLIVLATLAGLMVLRRGFRGALGL